MNATRKLNKLAKSLKIRKAILELRKQEDNFGLKMILLEAEKKLMEYENKLLEEREW